MIQNSDANWTYHLSQLFVGLWPKKKAEVPKDNLGKLAKAFDTIEDPTL
jgi:hypothetical protein